MQSITQKDDYGCGVACLAFATGNSYAFTAGILGKAKAVGTGFYPIELQLALGYLGYTYRYSRYTKQLESFLSRSGTIVLIQKSRTYPSGHYLIKTPLGWMDPWINLPADKTIKHAKSGYRDALPDKPYYILYRA